MMAVRVLWPVAVVEYSQDSFSWLWYPACPPQSLISMCMEAVVLPLRLAVPQAASIKDPHIKVSVPFGQEPQLLVVT
jgi:hypothetical protein